MLALLLVLRGGDGGGSYGSFSFDIMVSVSAAMTTTTMMMTVADFCVARICEDYGKIRERYLNFRSEKDS